MYESVPFLLSGISLGLAAGVAPGPLLALVISETLRHDRKQGVLVAIAPVLTDVPIVVLSVYILSRLAGSNIILGIVSLLGAAFVGYMAYGSITARGADLELDAVKADSLKKGIITNFLNPHPYVFWMTVGSPIILKAYAVNIYASVLFVSGFYLLLVGSKVALAFMVDRSRSFLRSSAYVYIVRALGLVLLIFSVLFIKEGLAYLGY